MARLFDGTAGQTLYWDGTIPALPITMAAWLYDAGDSNPTSMSVNASSTANNFRQMHTVYVSNATSRLRASSGSTSSADSASSSAYTRGGWIHATGAFIATNSRAVWVNGGGKGTNTGNLDTGALDRISVGSIYSSSSTHYFASRVAHAAIWSAALTDDEVAALYNNGIGCDPRQVRPETLVAYWPLLNNDGDADWWGQYNLTANGSPTYADNPPLLMPSGIVPVIQPRRTVTPPATNIPAFMRHYRNQRISA